jgi:hypothetical protein
VDNWRAHALHHRALSILVVSVTRDQELWGIALWLERTHGDAGPEHIAKEVARLAISGDEDGVAMWRAVAERYDRLRERGAVH